MKTRDLLHQPLYKFFIAGFVLWLLVFFVAPIEATQGFKSNTLIFIALSIIGYTLGYIFFKKIRLLKKQKTLLNTVPLSKQFIIGLIAIVYLSWAIRYFDVFYVRGVSFSNTIEANRALMGTAKLNVFYILGAIFKELYFVPLLLVLHKFRDNKILVSFSSLAFVFPLIMPFLRGTRKDIFLTAALLIIILIVTRVVILKLRTIIKIGIAVLVLNVIFYKLLMQRETPQNVEATTHIDYLLDYATYNDLLRPNENYKEKIKTSSGIEKALLFSYVHLSQYYCHGIFELNYLIQDKSKSKLFLNGEYNFHLFKKALASFGLIDYDSSLLHYALPRQNTYITFMGALFLDFGWFGLLGMLLMGMGQRYIDEEIEARKYLYLGLYVFFIIFNLFLPVINLIRGTGVYFIFASLLIIICYKILIRLKIKASL